LETDRSPRSSAAASCDMPSQRLCALSITCGEFGRVEAKRAVTTVFRATATDNSRHDSVFWEWFGTGKDGEMPQGESKQYSDLHLGMRTVKKQIIESAA